MSSHTQKLIEICEQLPKDQQLEVVDFARDLLARNDGATSTEATDRWLAGARGAAKPGITTDQVMELTRGDK